MKIKLDDPSQMLSHFLLQNREVVDAVIDTKEWKEDNRITATVFMNGVEVSAESFEEVLQEFWGQMERSFQEKYQSVEKRAEDLIRERAKDLSEKMHNISYELDSLYVDLSS